MVPIAEYQREDSPSAKVTCLECLLPAFAFDRSPSHNVFLSVVEKGRMVGSPLLLECSAAFRARPWSLYRLLALLRHGARVNLEIHISSLRIMPNHLTMHCCPTHGPSNARWPAAVSLFLHFYPIGASHAGSLSLPLLLAQRAKYVLVTATRHLPADLGFLASGTPPKLPLRR